MKRTVLVHTIKTQAFVKGDPLVVSVTTLMEAIQRLVLDTEARVGTPHSCRRSAQTATR